MTWSPASGAWNAQIPHGDGIFAPSLCTTTNSEYRLPRRRLHSDRSLGGRQQGHRVRPDGRLHEHPGVPGADGARRTARLAAARPRRHDRPAAGGRGGHRAQRAVDSQPSHRLPRRAAFHLERQQAVPDDGGCYGPGGRDRRLVGRLLLDRQHGNSERIAWLRRLAAVPQHRRGLRQLRQGRGVLGPITTTPFQGSGGTAACTSGLPIFGGLRVVGGLHHSARDRRDQRAEHRPGHRRRHRAGATRRRYTQARFASPAALPTARTRSFTSRRASTTATTASPR